MRTLFVIAAVAALVACSQPDPGDDSRAGASKGAETVGSPPAAPVDTAPAEVPPPTAGPADGAPSPSPTPTLPVDQPTDSPAAGTPEPDE